MKQAHELGFTKPIVGSDSWGSAETVKLCGKDCYGLFFSTHYAAAGATGATKEFIDRYQKKYGYVPDDVAALTWDSTPAGPSRPSQSLAAAHRRPRKRPPGGARRHGQDQGLRRHHRQDDLHRRGRPHQVRRDRARSATRASSSSTSRFVPEIRADLSAGAGRGG